MAVPHGAKRESARKLLGQCPPPWSVSIEISRRSGCLQRAIDRWKKPDMILVVILAVITTVGDHTHTMEISLLLWQKKDLKVCPGIVDHCSPSAFSPCGLIGSGPIGIRYRAEVDYPSFPLTSNR